MADAETITQNEYIALKRIVGRQRIQHGEVTIRAIVVNGAIKEVHLDADHRMIVKKIITMANADNNN